jgi:hypothetical protein
MAQPSVKDQLVQTAVGLGVTVALGAAVLGIGAGIDAIGRAVQNRKAKKAQKASETALHAVDTDNE